MKKESRQNELREQFTVMNNKGVTGGKPGADIMTQGGREMKGYVHVQSEGYEADQDLQFWVDKCLAFNPKAKASKRKK